MAYIITSKTRAKIMRQPKERAKLMSDRRMKSHEKHAVETVTPVNSMSELEIHEDMDKQGSGVKEAMEATREANEQKRKMKEEAMRPQKQKIIRERVEKLKERDRKNGVLQKAERKRRNKK